MKKLTTTALLLSTVISSSASAAILFDQNVMPDVIFGSGNTNGSFTTDTANGIELGLRGKLRHDAAGNPQNIFNSNGDGTYSFDSGVAPTQSAPTGVWSVEWAINSNVSGMGGFLDDFTYLLSFDTDPSAGVSFFEFDPINGINGNSNLVAWDHSIGTNSTGNGLGAEVSNTDTAGYSAAIANNNVAQNSWKALWVIPGYDPTVDGTFDIMLQAIDRSSGDILSKTSIQIIQGAGAAIPEPGTIAIFLTGLLGLAARKKFAK